MKMTLGMWRLVYQDAVAVDRSLSEKGDPSDVDPLQFDAKSADETLETPLVDQDESSEGSCLTSGGNPGNPSTSQFHAMLGEQNPIAEVFLKAGGNEANVAALKFADATDHAYQDGFNAGAARMAGYYVKQFEQLQAHMAWSKARIESISLQVVAANWSSVAWQRIAERTRNDLVKKREARSTLAERTRDELVKESEVILTLAQRHESLTPSHTKLASDIWHETVGVGAPVADGIDCSAVFPIQQAQFEQLDH
jgi:hypothetical protein